MAVNRLACLCMLGILGSTSYAHSGMDRFWSLFRAQDDATEEFDDCEHMSKEQQQQLIKTFQNLKNDEQKLDLKKRMEWFCQLGDTEQDRMRIAWQNMSTQERNTLKKKLQTATNVEERQEIRQEMIEKYSGLGN